MKSAIRLLIFASALLAVVLAYPGAPRSAGPEEEGFDQLGPILVVSDDFEDGFGGGFFNSWRNNPFNNFVEKMQTMMHTLRQKLSESIPNYGTGGGIFGLENIPEGANTTSTTKIIDGHVVTVNETTYRDGDDVQGTIFRVRVVDIKPQTETILTENPEVESVTTSEGEVEELQPTTPAERSVESVEDFSNNEIPEKLIGATPV